MSNGSVMAIPFSFSISAPTGRGNFHKRFLLKDFDGFDREVWPQINYVTLTQYDATYPSPFIFAPEELRQILAEVVSERRAKRNCASPRRRSTRT